MSNLASRVSLRATRAAITAGDFTHGLSQTRVQIAKPHLLGHSSRSASTYPSSSYPARAASSSTSSPPRTTTSPNTSTSSNQSAPTAVPARPAAPKPATPASTPSTPSPPVSAATRTTATRNEVSNLLESGLSDDPFSQKTGGNVSQNTVAQELQIDWTRSYHGLSSEPFSKEAAAVLLQETPFDDVEIKPDGIVYLPEIKYRRILNKAFGPGGWGLVPRGESLVTPKMVTREYALVAHGRLVSIARGEQDYFSPDGIPTATEGCKSNAMMRCCKDLGVASELWDPRWIRKFKANFAREVFVEHVVNKRKSKVWVRKGDPVSYPWKETK